MKAVLAGLGAREVLQSEGAGSVVASFRDACYVEVGGVLIALVGPAVHPGPVHLVLEGQPPRPEPGRSVRVGGGALVVDGVPIDVVGTEQWRGELPAADAVLEHASEIAEVAARGAARSALRSEPFRSNAERARARLEQGRLEEAAGLLSGLGPGLTPSGDDALCGIAFGLRAALGPAVEFRASALSEAPGIGGFGREALSFAARGQALAPVHALVSSVVGGNAAAAEVAMRAVAAIGETSGADLLEGLWWTFAGSAVYAVAASEGVEVEPAASAR